VKEETSRCLNEYNKKNGVFRYQLGAWCAPLPSQHGFQSIDSAKPHVEVVTAYIIRIYILSIP
jgi:hypothetical protein